MDRTIIYFFLIFPYLKFCISEFQFCLNGPQKLTEKDCPGGLLLLTPLKTDTCTLLGKSKNSPELKVELNSTVCGSGTVETLETRLSRSGPAIKTDMNFQTIKLMAMGGDSPTDVPITPVDAKCIEECLTEYVDPSTGLEDDPPYDFGTGPPQIPETEKQTSDRLFAYLSNELDTPGAVPDSASDLKILDIFRKSLEVLEKHCRSPYVNPGFIHRIYAAHRWLVRETRTKINDLGIREHRLIIDGLNKCLVAPPKFVINGTACGTGSKAINSQPHKLEPKSFRWGTFDPMIEAAWNALEFVHGYCFKEYSEDFIFQHILVKAIEALFNERITTRWRSPLLDLKHESFWGNLLDAPRLETTMRNIDACIQGGWRLSPYQARLGRPFEEQPGKFSPSGPASTLAANNKPKGYFKSIDNYWMDYESKGGIHAGIIGLGFCAQSGTQLEEYMKAAVGHCSPDEEESEYSEEWDKAY